MAFQVCYPGYAHRCIFCGFVVVRLFWSMWWNGNSGYYVPGLLWVGRCLGGIYVVKFIVWFTKFWHIKIITWMCSIPQTNASIFCHSPLNLKNTDFLGRSLPSISKSRNSKRNHKGSRRRRKQREPTQLPEWDYARTFKSFSKKPWDLSHPIRPNAKPAISSPPLSKELLFILQVHFSR